LIATSVLVIAPFGTSLDRRRSSARAIALSSIAGAASGALVAGGGLLSRAHADA
jgi:hypothetical protein